MRWRVQGINRMKAGLVWLLVSVLAGCFSPPGGDRDRHGCLGSGGYQWCPRVAECVRSWELAEERGFEATPEAFLAWCTAETSDGAR